jgi:succinate dehydrogenase / fumarate reductase cytochrome b subunit
MSKAAPAPRGPADRPLSPHLGIWRWHITMATSILHRASGVALYLGALILAGWAVALARGPAAFADYRALLASPPGQFVLFGLTVSLFYHLASGLRHLWWDTGRGFDPKIADMTGAAAIAFGGFAALAIWLAALFGGAGG